MDNDVPGTEYAIGFSTAITRAKDAVNRQRTTLGSHERIGIFRIFGRDSGFTALQTGYVTSGRCVIPEHRFDLDQPLRADERRTRPTTRAATPSSSPPRAPPWHLDSEVGGTARGGNGAREDVGRALAAAIRERTGEETMHSDLTYDLRSGDPDALDQTVATTFANLAIDLLGDGVTGRMVAIRNGCYAHVDLPDRALGPRKVDVEALYDAGRFRPRYSGKLGSPLLLGAAEGV